MFLVKNPTLSLEGSQEYLCITNERSGSKKVKYTKFQAYPWSVSALRATQSHLKCFCHPCDLTMRPAFSSVIRARGLRCSLLSSLG